MVDARRITELADRMGRLAHGLQFAGGLNPAQWQALRFLARANRYSCSPGALADYLGVTKGTASQTLIALETKGFISRSRCPTDRRSVAICVTDAGQDLLKQDPLQTFQTAARALGAEESSALADCMERLIRLVQNAQGLPEFGVCVECDNFRPECRGKSDEIHCRCAMTGDLLAPVEQNKICVGFKANCKTSADLPPPAAAPGRAE